MKFKSIDSLDILASFELDNQTYYYYNIPEAAKKLGFDINQLPYSLRILFENALRFEDGLTIDGATLLAFKNWLKAKKSTVELAFMPSRVLMQDFTGVPAVVDLAAMRDAVKSLGGDPQAINPLIPVDLVIDHSVQVDVAGKSTAFAQNVELEMQRNEERYSFLRWGQEAFTNFRVVPPGTGICHQVNLEYLAQVAWISQYNGLNYVYPDSLVGTDSHTTMINGLAVLGWGVGGIEAEAAMLGQALPMLIPEVIGFKMTGRLSQNINATDLVLTITEMLRKKNVVGKFVEFYGEGLSYLPLADRATISNMAPEYGATCGFFPVDAETIKYLTVTARDPHRIKLVETYAKLQNLWRDNNKIEPTYTDTLVLDLSTVEVSLAGPKRPQDRISLSKLAAAFSQDLPSLTKNNANIEQKYPVEQLDIKIGHGDIVLAAITSCTNTSNPSVMVAAGLLAKKACELGLAKKPWVKTSLAPGSKVVTEYLQANGLDIYLDKLGFNLVGYGCTSCIGNSGPLDPYIDAAITKNKIVAAAVLSGNRNFEGRIHPNILANYLASPPLVVAYALAGTVNINLHNEPLTHDANGKAIYLKDLWPTQAEIDAACSKIDAVMFREKYSDVFTGDAKWQAIKVEATANYLWDANSTYIKNPPYFANIANSHSKIADISSAKILAIFGDSITTDHISPAGDIAKDSPAAQYLISKDVNIADFNSYGARRGNHEVMMRGTFANIRLRNELCHGIEGGVTTYATDDTASASDKQIISIFEAAMLYKESKQDLVVIGGKEYGTGSSRDWAAKGTRLLGVKAVIAESFERIHRSNLIGMGVLAFTFTKGMTRKELNLQGSERFNIVNIDQTLKPKALIDCEIIYPDGKSRMIELCAAILTDDEIDYLKNGSILHKVVRSLAASKSINKQ